MSYIVIPSRRLRQPLGRVKVSPQYESSLLSLVSPFQQEILPLTVGSGASITASAGTLGWTFNDSTSGYLTNAATSPDKTIGYPLTCVVYGVVNAAASTSYHTLTAIANSTDYFARILAGDATKNVLAQHNGGSGQGSAASGSSIWSIGVPAVFGGVFSGGASAEVFYNGASKGVNTTSIGATTNHNRITYGGYWGGSQNYYADATIYWGAWWTRVLAVAELIELAQYPYSVFVPDVRLVYFSVSSATGTDAAIAPTQATDVAAIAVEATTGVAIAGVQASDVAAVNVTASTGTGTDAEVSATQASDVAAVAVSATTGVAIAPVQSSDVAQIQVSATLGAAIAANQGKDIAAILTAGVSIWTPQSAASTTWANRSAASTTWTNA